MRAWRVMVWALAVAVGGCAGEDAAPTATEPPSAAPSTTARVTTTPATLPSTATCGDYLDATEPQRVNATRAALIVARQGAGGVTPTPSEELRTLFELAVGLVCREERSARMLTVMALVVARDSSYVNK